MNRFKITLMFSALFVAGVFIGTFSSGLISAERCFAMINPFVSQCGKSRTEVFVSSFLYSVKPLIFMWICGFTQAAFYCCGAALLYRGGILGFVSGGIVRMYGAAKGCILIFAGILPQNIIYIPLIVYAASVVFIYSKNRKYINIKSMFFIGGLFVIGSLIASLCDSVITYDLLNRGIQSVTNG